MKNGRKAVKKKRWRNKEGIKEGEKGSCGMFPSRVTAF